MTNIPFTGEFKVTNEFGVKNSRYAAGFHTGIDLVGITSDKVYSPANGTINKTGSDKSYGLYVDIIDSFKHHHWLCHLKQINVSQGQKVTKASVVGIMGSTGNSTGPHTHYEIRTEKNKYGDVLNPAVYMGIPNEKGTYNSNDYKVEGEVYILKNNKNQLEMKTLNKNTNLRSEPTIKSKEKSLYLAGTTLYVLEPAVKNADGYIWDKVEIRVNHKQGYMINKNYRN